MSEEINIYGDLAQEAAPTADEAKKEEDRYYLNLSRQCYKSSTDFLNVNFRTQWEKNLAHFNNEHAKDSKFHASNYRNRNKLFRPKTRAISLKGEAALRKAMFATNDYVNISAENEGNLIEELSSEVMENLLDFRLKDTIPWMQTVLGAWQDTFNYGICISYQYWAFETKTEYFESTDIDQEGNYIEEESVKIIRDEPAVDLIEPENFRFDPGCDWRDPAKTSPYLIRLEPMKVDEVLKKMNSTDTKTGKAEWRKYSVAEILSAGSTRWSEEESIRRAREGVGKEDPYKNHDIADEFENVWCREHIVREDGEDIVYWTIGNDLMLTDPVPLSEAYFHGQRPFRVGVSLIESHKTIPNSKNEMIAPIQEAINKGTNQRADNVDLVLNKRYFLRRGQNIDTPALMRNVPGGGVYMDDPATDVKIVTTPDVTSSSYEEQNRLSNEMDEIAGNFSSSSVQSNRELNETVGGMQMNHQSADELTEYSIAIFIETWVTPVLKQLMLLEEAYETDQVVLQMAAGKSKAWKRMNLKGDVPEQILAQKLKLNVNVGIGNTDPVRKADMFTRSITGILSVMPQAALRLNEDEVIKEIIGGAGRSDGERFFKKIEEMQGQEQQPDPEVVKHQQQLQFDKYKYDLEIQYKTMLAASEEEQFYARLAQEKEISMEDLYAKLGIESSKLAANNEMIRLQETNKKNELLFKATTGRQGI